MPMKIGKTWVPLTNLRGHENRISSIGLFHIGIAYGSTAWRKHEIVYKLSKVSLTKRVKKEIDDKIIPMIRKHGLRFVVHHTKRICR